MTVKLRSIGRKLHPPTRAKVALPTKKVGNFYLAPEWRGFIAHLIKIRGRRCQDPLHDPDRPRDGVRIFGDHVIELQDGGAPLDPFNVMLRCGSCHSRKTAEHRKQRYQTHADHGSLAHPNDLKPSCIPLTLVCGPPASGKSTYARSHAAPGALIIDMDNIASSLSGQSLHGWDRRWLVPALGHRNQLLRQIAQPNRWTEAWFIVGEPQASRRAWWDEKLKPSRVVVLATAPSVCWQRIAADPDRQAKRADVSAAVAQWWAEWRRRPTDHVVDQSDA